MKKRTLSQQTGDSGEKFFDQFADRYLGLVPSKVPNDYGIDFFCLSTKSLPDTSQDVRPTVIGSIVKSTAKKSRRPRASLDKNDIEFALKSDFPILFVLVDLNNDRVFLRFFDNQLLETFHDILAKGGQSFTLMPTRMFSGSKAFRRALSHVIRPEYQQTLRMRAVELRLRDIIGPVRLRVHSSTGGGYAVVKVPNLRNLFLPEDQQQVREVLLTSRYDRPLPLPTTPFQDSIVGEVGRLASRIALVAPIPGEAAESLFIKEDDAIQAECLFDLRWAGDEMSYHHPSGLSIIISAARKGDDGLYYHHTRVTYGDQSADRLFEHPKIITFLKECKEGAEICLGDPHKEGIPITHFSELTRLQLVISDLELIYRELGIVEPSIKFCDLLDDKIKWSHGLLASLFHIDRQDDIWPGFAFTPEEVPVNWVNSIIFCPLFLALPEGPSIVEVVFSGRIGFVEESPVGARFDQYKSMRFCNPSEYGGEFKEQPSSPLLLIDGKNAMKFHETHIEQVSSPCNMGISYSPEN